MDRRAVLRNVRRLSPFVALVTVLALLAAGIPALVLQPPGGRSQHGLAVQAPGSSGSVRSLPRWDPRGWFGGSGTPSTPAIADVKPAAGRPPGQVAGYPGIAPGVSLSYQVTPQSLVERITLASPAAVTSEISLHPMRRASVGDSRAARTAG